MNTPYNRLWFSLCIVLWLVYSLCALLSYELSADVFSFLLAFLTAFIFLQNARSGGRSRPGWFFLFLAAASWGFCDLLWAVDTFVFARNPEDNVPLMYLYALPNLFFLAAVLYIAASDRQRWGFVQFIVDTLSICIALAAFLYFSFFSANLESWMPFDHPEVSSFLYLIFDMLLVSFSASLYLSFKVRKIPLYLNILFIGTVLYAAVDVVYIYAVFNGQYFSNSWVDILYMLSLTVVGAGAVLYGDYSLPVKEIRRDMPQVSGLTDRSLILLAIPVLNGVIRKIYAEEVLFFLFLILVHQIVTLLIRRLIQGEYDVAEKSRQAENLEALVADRTRDLRIMNQTLENLLKRDATTGQFNRKYFLERIEEMMDNAEEGEKVWMLILDLDRFKTVNDTYGHDIGDQALRLIGRRLNTLSNERTFIARLGGDEFGVACLRDSHESITPLLHTIADMSEMPLQVDRFTLHVSISIGVACWPDDAQTRSDLMRHADIAMYIAKSERTNGVSFFETSVNAGVERSHQIDLALKKARFPEEFTLVYQPQFAVGGRRLVGMEALVRWMPDDLGLVTPDEFIPVAEENGVIIPLSDWIMHEAFKQIADWNTRYGTNLLVGINISPLQLDDLTFMLKLEASLEDFHVLPEWVNLEITERSAMKGENFIVQIFSRLAGLNITSSIDDFGTGYSSLSYLKKFDIDYLKIAKQLIDGIATNETDAQIVQAIIMMATAMNLHTIAEGVEDEAQLRILESLGCDEIQGYFFGKPVPPDEFEELFLKGEFGK